jgi:phosphoribosylformylglycinamidine synthase subunit PurSL
MVSRIAVYKSVFDARARNLQKNLSNLDLSGNVSSVEIVDIYTIDKKFTDPQLKSIATILINPVIEWAKIRIQNGKNVRNDILINIQNLPEKKFDYAIEIGFLPGVTDNVANTLKQSIEDHLKIKFENSENVYSSQVLIISGEIKEKDVYKIADSLSNPLIQRSNIKSASHYKKEGGMDFVVPKVSLESAGQVIEVDLDVSDEELEKIGKEGILDPNTNKRRGPLALELDYMKTIREYFNKKRRNPTDIELESLAQTWSEHCKHTIFRDSIHDLSQGLFKRYIQKTTEMVRKKKGKKDICVSVFSDNSGAIEFDDKYLITHKVETHNTPSALDPFGGAITGIVGVNRDALGFGLGAKPIFNTYGFCFADPDDKEPLYRDKNLNQKMLSPRRIMDGVIAGVNAGGNQSGIPTPQGFLYFDPRYKGKPLVFCGTVGLIPKKTNSKKSWEKKAQAGDYVVMVGGRVGLDGIHGATFSSVALDEGSPSTAVQIGDPITQKKFSDALAKEARDLGLYSSITDNGAGGLSSSISEMSRESGGCRIDIDKVPLKYPGLDPWQIWISESQERMTLAVPKNKWKIFESLMNRRGVESTVIGEFTDSGKCVITQKGKTILDLEMEFLHEGLAPRQLEPGHSLIIFKDPEIPEFKDLTNSYLKMLKRLNFSGFEFISTQYDHEVQGTSVLKPLQGRGLVNSEVSVVKPLYDSNRGVVLSQGIYPLYSDINTYDMTACSIDTAIRNVVTMGADLDHIAILDNFCWCSSTESNRLGQLRRAARACHEVALQFGVPFISGKDSMFNDFKGFDKKGNPVKISIPPTLLVSSIGIVDDVLKCSSLDFKFPGDLIYILGETHSEMGGSEFYMMHSKDITKLGHRLPVVNVFKNMNLYNAYLSCLKAGLIASVNSITRGGLGIALARSAMAGLLGVEVKLSGLEGEAYREDFALFSETQGRILISINPTNKLKFERIMGDNSYSLIGQVGENSDFIIKGIKGQEVVRTKVEKLLETYKRRFRDF